MIKSRERRDCCSIPPSSRTADLWDVVKATVDQFVSLMVTLPDIRLNLPEMLVHGLSRCQRADVVRASQGCFCDELERVRRSPMIIRFVGS